MSRQVSQKLKKWTKNNYISNIALFIVNVTVIGLIFAGAVYLNALAGDLGFYEYFSQSREQFIYLLLTLLLIIGVMAVYFYFEDRDFLRLAVNTEMIFLIIEISLIFNFIAGRYVDIYVRPMAFAALLTLVLVNRRSAIFINMVVSLITFLMDVFTNASFSGYTQYASLVIGFTSGVLAVFCMDKVHFRSVLLLRSFILVVPTVVCLILLEQSAAFTDWTRTVAGAVSGVVAVVLFMAALPFFENIFSKITPYKLAELTDHRALLIRKMIEVAPGTFNHSIVVSNIAEACATAIGEDALLARTCAYYHDIGKLHQPEFFRENQPDDNNPHDGLTPELSANIIKAHAKDGYDLVKKYHLPQIIADVCLEHHGTMPILFFYDKARKFTDGGDVGLENFSYPGPKPQTKISAIVMIADSSEAAVRTLKDRTRENVTSVVRKIVGDRMSLGQFEQCEITLQEISIIIHTVVNNLTGVYHSRIEYPKINLQGLTSEINDKGKQS